jgi:hypothetical protein
VPLRCAATLGERFSQNRSPRKIEALHSCHESVWTALNFQQKSLRRPSLIMSLPSLFRFTRAAAAALFGESIAVAEVAASAAAPQTLRAVVVVYTEASNIENRAVAPMISLGGAKDLEP